MPPKVEPAPTESRHFKITGFNPSIVRNLVNEYREVTKEIAETEELLEQTKAEVAKLQKSTKFTNEKQLEILSMKRLQADMIPNKINELEEKQAALSKEMNDIVVSGKHGLLSAVGKLVSHEANLIANELTNGLTPVLGSEKEAREVALKSQRYVQFKNRFGLWTYMTDRAKGIETALGFLDLYDRAGTLETTGN